VGVQVFAFSQGFAPSVIGAFDLVEITRLLMAGQLAVGNDLLAFRPELAPDLEGGERLAHTLVSWLELQDFAAQRTGHLLSDHDRATELRLQRERPLLACLWLRIRLLDQVCLALDVIKNAGLAKGRVARETVKGV